MPAYVNATIVEQGKGTFQADAGGAIALYQRVKFSTTADSYGNGKPTLVVAGATDRAIGVAMQAIPASGYGTIRLLNGPGEQFGNASGTIGLGVLVYQAASGALTAASGGGALIAGISTTPGYDGGPFTYMPLPNAA